MNESLTPHLPEGYDGFLRKLRARIQQAQVKAALAMNRELILLYWKIGKEIAERQEEAGWGSVVLDQLSEDLNFTCPDVSGFSRRNLYRMRAIYLAYRDDPEVVPRIVAQIPWGHNAVLLEKLETNERRLWYAQQTVENGWSRSVLIHKIETDLFAHQVEAPKTTNFPDALPPPHPDLAKQALKDPYVFDFLSLGKELVREAVPSWTQTIDDIVYDLMAINPHFEEEVDDRKPEALIQVIEEQGREVASALAALRALLPKTVQV